MNKESWLVVASVMALVGSLGLYAQSRETRNTGRVTTQESPVETQGSSGVKTTRVTLDVFQERKIGLLAHHKRID